MGRTIPAVMAPVELLLCERDGRPRWSDWAAKVGESSLEAGEGSEG